MGRSRPLEQFEASTATIPEIWGKGAGIGGRVPSIADDPGLPAIQAWWGKAQRNAATPAGWEAFARMAFDIDVRDVVPSIHVPALIMHTAGDRVCHVENARWLAAHLAGARYVEIPRRRSPAVVRPRSDRRGDPGVHHGLARARGAGSGAGDGRCSRTSSARPSWPRGSVTGAGATCSRRHHAAVRAELARYRGREVDTAGDGFLAVFDGPARAIRAAKSIVDAVRGLGLEIRAGIHTGEIEQLPSGDIRGIAVHVGARVAAAAGAGEVLVSSSVRDLVAGSGFTFADRGVHQLKGVEEERRLYAVSA